MPTITKRAIEWMQDQAEEKDALIADLEEELEAALADNAALKAALLRERATPQD